MAEQEQSQGQEALICGVGMVTAVGDCTAQTASSVWAGISRYGEGPVYNRHFKPMTMAVLPDDALPELVEPLEKPGLTSRQIRMIRLGAPALQEAVQGIGTVSDAPLFVGLPEPLPGQKPPISSTFLQQLQAQSEIEFDLTRSEVFSGGRASGVEALAAALELLESGERQTAIVGGVDTYLDLKLLATLDAEDRILAEGVMDGFAPGEAGSFLVLAREGAAPQRKWTPIAKLLKPGLADEPGHRYSEEPYRGDGLAEAVTASLEPLDGNRVQSVLCSMNGENINAKEWGVAFLRNSSNLEPDYRIEHPADCFGDTGSAIGPLLMGLAALGIQSGRLPQPALIWCSSDGPKRGAVCVRSLEG